MRAVHDPTATRVRHLLPDVTSVDLGEPNGLGVPAGRYWAVATGEDPEPWSEHAGAAQVVWSSGGEFLVRAPEGGLLSDLIAARAGLAEGEVVTVVVGLLDAIRAVPPEEPGRTRLDATCVALDHRGRPHLIPGLSVDGGVPSAPARVGHLAYHAISGRRWEDAAVPIPHAAAEASTRFQDWLMARFDDDEAPWSPDADAAALRSGLAAVAEARPIGLRPSASTAEPEDAPTGSLARGSILAALLSHAAGPQEAPPARLPVEGSGDTRTDVGGGRAASSTGEASRGRAREGRARPAPRSAASRVSALLPSAGSDGQHLRPRLARRRRVRRTTLIWTAASAALLIAVAAWAVPELPGEEATPAAASVPARVPTTGPVGGTPAPSTAVPDDAAGLAVDGDPEQALVDLTEIRTEMLASGRADRLAELTVPGSPAEEAEAALADQWPAGSLEDLTISVEDIEVVAGECTADASEGSRCTLSAVSVTSAYRERRDGATREIPASRVPLDFGLQRTDAGWRVESVR